MPTNHTIAVTLVSFLFLVREGMNMSTYKHYALDDASGSLAAICR
jgi:hypothetical protein